MESSNSEVVKCDSSLRHFSQCHRSLVLYCTYVHAPVRTYGEIYYSTTTTSDVVVVYNTSGPWNLMLSGHANY